MYLFVIIIHILDGFVNRIWDICKIELWLFYNITTKKPQKTQNSRRSGSLSRKQDVSRKRKSNSILFYDTSLASVAQLSGNPGPFAARRSRAEPIILRRSRRDFFSAKPSSIRPPGRRTIISRANRWVSLSVNAG